MKEDKKVIIIANSSIGEICSSKLLKDQEKGYEIILNPNQMKEFNKAIESEIQRNNPDCLNLTLHNVYKDELEKLDNSLSFSNYQRTLSSSIDIYKEYDLILEKKSKLSKWEREQVVKNIKNKIK